MYIYIYVYIYIYGNPPTRTYLKRFLVVFTAKDSIFCCPAFCVLYLHHEISVPLASCFFPFLTANVSTAHPRLRLTCSMDDT